MTLGEVDFFLTGGEAPLEGDDVLPERSSDVTARLALWELSERSLKHKHAERFEREDNRGEPDLSLTTTNPS